MVWAIRSRIWWAVAIERSSVVDGHGDLPLRWGRDQDGVHRGRTIKEHGDLRGRLADVPGLGSLDIRAPASPLEALLREDEHYVLSTEVLERCAGMDSPATESSLRRLFDSWLAADRKPRISGTFSYLEGGQEVSFLIWLLSERPSDSVNTLIAYDSVGFRILLDYVAAVKAQAEAAGFGPGRGGAMGYARWSAHKRKLISFIEALLEAAGSAG
jgi:hypothetical protein